MLVIYALGSNMIGKYIFLAFINALKSLFMSKTKAENRTAVTFSYFIKDDNYKISTLVL